MYLGRQQLGSWLDIYLAVTDSTGKPAMPNSPPSIKIRKAGAVVYSGRIPLISDPATGIFCTRIFLGNGFTIGNFSVEMVYSCGAKTGFETRTFEVIPGGNVHGNALAMHWYHRPQADFVVFQTEDGSIMQGKNPRVN